MISMVPFRTKILGDTVFGEENYKMLYKYKKD